MMPEMARPLVMMPVEPFPEFPYLFKVIHIADMIFDHEPSAPFYPPDHSLLLSRLWLVRFHVVLGLSFMILAQNLPRCSSLYCILIRTGRRVRAHFLQQHGLLF
jgi:hypothetical protein